MAPTIVVAPPAALGTPTVLRLPLEVTFARPRPLTVVLVGAGGTGARLGPDIARLLGRGDTLIVMDPDVVETHNLTRQHFVRGDVGHYKAEIVAGRAVRAAPDGVEVEARITRLEDLSSVGDRSVLWVGCVDNRVTRARAASYITGNGGMWFDAGNELRGGQVGMVGRSVVVSVVDPNRGGGPIFPTPATEAAVQSTMSQGTTAWAARTSQGGSVLVNTIHEITPQILVPDAGEEAATETCAVRMDTQSLAANVMAYALLINWISRFVDELPISIGAAFFSTTNTMQARPFMGLVMSASNVRRATLSTIALV